MWRLASYVYRAFRNTAPHRCPHDVIIPTVTAYNGDDDSKEEKNECAIVDHPKSCCGSLVLKCNKFSYRNFEELEERLHKSSRRLLKHKANYSFKKAIDGIREATNTYLSQHKSEQKSVSSTPIPVQPIVSSSSSSLVQTSKPSSIASEETLETLLKADESYAGILKSLSDLHEDTLSMVNNQLAVEALETGNIEFGIETLQASVKSGNNAAALFNLAMCYERGIGVEQDRAKACDYYRQASALGHLSAQFNLTLLSNHIDIYDSDDDEDEIVENTVIVEPPPQISPRRTVRLSVATTTSSGYTSSEDEQSSSPYYYDLNRTIACL